MKVMIDLNIFIDVFQKRVPHYQDSSLVFTKILNKDITGFIAGHSVTTLYYLISKFSGRQKALDVIDWILDHFEVESAGKEGFQKARKLDIKDFEDAVVVKCAQSVGCDYIITRNSPDFKKSSIPVVTPESFLKDFFKEEEDLSGTVEIPDAEDQQ
jgi:predicted nucleic acid-binding protein